MGQRWTDAEHALVASMSEERYSAEEIATVMGRSIAMIYKKRAELGIRPMRCEHCRGSLPVEITRGRPLSYCSLSCVVDSQWAYEYNATLDARPKTCEHCHAPLDLSRKVVRFCGRRCKDRAWWERAMENPAIIQSRREARARRYWRDRDHPTSVVLTGS